MVHPSAVSTSVFSLLQHVSWLDFLLQLHCALKHNAVAAGYMHSCMHYMGISCTLPDISLILDKQLVKCWWWILYLSSCRLHHNLSRTACPLCSPVMLHLCSYVRKLLNLLRYPVYFFLIKKIPDDQHLSSRFGYPWIHLQYLRTGLVAFCHTAPQTFW